MAHGFMLSRIELLESRLCLSGNPPVANDDAYSTPEDTPLVITAPGLLANDSDPEGDPMTVAIAAGPAHGTLTIRPDGSFTYTPDVGFDGTDSITYRVADSSTQMQLLPSNATWNYLHPLNGSDSAMSDPDFNSTWQTWGLPDSNYDGPPFFARSGPARAACRVEAST